MLLAFVLLVHVGLLWIYWHPQPKSLLGDEARYRRWADDLVAGRVPEPDLLWPPLYPRFLALVLRSPDASILRVQVVQTALLVLVALLLLDLARRLTGRPAAAEAAAWLVLAYPPLVAFAHYLWPEVLHLALFLSALWILVARRESLRWMPLAGLLLTVSLLVLSVTSGIAWSPDIDPRGTAAGRGRRRLAGSCLSAPRGLRPLPVAGGPASRAVPLGLVGPPRAA